MSRWDDPSTVWGEFFWDAPEGPPTPPRKKPKINRRTMASNPTPDNNKVLRALADRLADGCHQHEVALGIKQNTETAVRASIGALESAETAVGLKKVALDEATTDRQAADDAGETVLTNCRLRLAAKLGQRWNAAWEPTGFPHQSTAVPNTQDERFTLLKDLKNYFTAVPANESAEMGATAALCDAAWETLSSARQGEANAESALSEAFRDRTAAEAGLRSRVRGLINELEQLLAEDDARWEDFGLNIPANPTAPEAVGSVTLAPASNHRIEVAWTYAVRAVRYRVQVKVAGVDTDWRTAATVKDLEVILKGFAAGESVEVRVIAANDGGDAAPVAASGPIVVG